MPTPTEMDYTNRDYDSIRQFLVTTALTVMPDWATAGEPGDFGTLLLELFSVVGDGLNYYIDRVAAEPFLQTAVRRQSLLAIADLLGYVPVALQAATVLLTFAVDDTAFTSTPVSIGPGTVVQTKGDRNSGIAPVYFEVNGFLTLGQTTNADGSLGPNVRSGTMGATEGRSIAAEFCGTSNGAPLQEFPLSMIGTIQRSVGVQVTEADGALTTWDFVDRLTDAGPNASVYTTYVDDSGYMHLRFGDAVSGRIPPINATINADYRYGQGALGNVVAGAIDTITPPMPGVSVINAAAAAGGANPESVDNMRYSIPRAAHTLDRAVTLSDFESLSMRVPGVAKATAYGVYYTMIHVPIAPVGGGLPSTDLKARVQDYLSDRMMIGSSCVVEDPQYVSVTVALVVHVLPSYSQANTLKNVQNAVAALFDFTVVSFGSRISIGDVFRTAMSVSGVDYVTLTSLYLGTGTGVTDIVPGPLQLPTLPAANFTATAVGGLT